MIGKITEEGRLKIFRSKEYKYQHCCFNYDVICSDDCPLFGEPKEEKNEKADGTIQYFDRLQLCQRVLYFEELLDERVKE